MQTILIAERDESRPYNKQTILIAERDESRPYDKTRISINKNKTMKKRNYTFPQSFIAGFLLLVGGLVVWPSLRANATSASSMTTTANTPTATVKSPVATAGYPKEKLSSRLKRIQQQYGVDINYDSSNMDNISVKAARKVSVENDLANALAATPYSYRKGAGAKSYVVYKDANKPRLTPTAQRQASATTGRGTIAGTVLDKEGFPVIGATVMVVGMSGKGGVTDIKGHYKITNLPARSFTVEASCISFQKMRISDVKVRGGKSTPLDFILQEATNELQGVTVTASYGNATTNAMLAQQKNRMAMSDGISADLIRKTPDNNVAQVLGRVSGVTIDKGKYVVVRGMSERYNNVQLNGAALPSTEPNKRNFSFDVIPAGLVDKVTIAKTFTPDLPAEFTGGLVEVNTLSVPTKKFLNVSIGTGINTISTGKTMETGINYASDYLFGNIKDRKWATEDHSAEAADVYCKNAAQRNPIQFFKYKALPLQTYSLTAGIPITLHNGHKLGAVLALTYRNEQTIHNIKEARMISADSLFRTNRAYNFVTATGAVLNMGWQARNHKITWRNLFNNRFTHTTTDRFIVTDYTAWWTRELYSNPLRTLMFQTQMDGEHKFWEDQLILTWNASYNKVNRTNPNTALVEANMVGDRSTTNIFGWRPASGSASQFDLTSGHLMYSDLNESKKTVGVNVEHPFEVAGNKQRVKAGYMGTFRRSDFFQQYIKPHITSPTGQLPDKGLPLNDAFNPKWFEQGFAVYSPVGIMGSYADYYEGSQDVHAAYLMGDFTFFNRLHLTAGVRMEDAQTSTTTRTAILTSTSVNWNDTTISIKNTDWLPAATLVYNITPTLNARLAFSKTLARPEFRELTFTPYYRVEDRMITYTKFGDYVKQSKITNWDLRFEWYPSLGEVVSLSLFHKKFKDPAEVYTWLRQDGHNYDEIHANLPEATAKGIELNVRKSLGFLLPGSFLRDLWFTGNFSIIDGTVKLNYDESIQNSYKNRRRPLMGMSPYTVNAGLGYFGKKFSATVNYGRKGRSLLLSAENDAYDIYENPRNVLDLQLAAKFLKNRLEVKFNASDLLHEDYILYRNCHGYIDTSGNWSDIVDWTDKGMDYTPGDWVISRINKGVNLSLTVSYNL